MHDTKIRRLLAATALAALTSTSMVGLVGCSDVGGERNQPVASPPSSSGGALKGVCPDTVVFQTNWWQQAEYGGLYRLLGNSPSVDGNRNKVTGALVDGGADTGVRIEIRAGGPANNFTPSTSLLYTDDEIMFGGADLDQVAQLSGSGKPVLSVFAPLDLSPVVLMWDPAQHPEFHTIADIGKTDTEVNYFQGATYMAYLTGAGILRADQVTASYTGTPDVWRAKKGSIVQQGYVTNEVISYQRDSKIWGKPVAYQLVAGSGYPVYPETLTIRPDKLQQYSGCLHKLVPILQRATAAYAQDPGPTNELLATIGAQYVKSYGYTKQQGDDAVKAMLDNHILGNGPNGAVGDFDRTRVQRIIDIVTPIFAAQKTPVKSGVTVEDLVTNEFIDTDIGLG